MKIDLTPPTRSQYEDYDYEDAKDTGLIHRPLVGGSWVTHMEWKVEYAKSRMRLEATPYRRRLLSKALARLWLARKGERLETRVQWQNNTYQWHKIGVRKQS